jgi:hypothetical protein
LKMISSCLLREHYGIGGCRSRISSTGSSKVTRTGNFPVGKKHSWGFSISQSCKPLSNCDKMTLLYPRINIQVDRDEAIHDLDIPPIGDLDIRSCLGILGASGDGELSPWMGLSRSFPRLSSEIVVLFVVVWDCPGLSTLQVPSIRNSREQLSNICLLVCKGK